MSKSTNGASKNDSKPSKKGVVVNRRHNRTVNQDVAKSDPKWVDVGNGILKRVGKGEKQPHIKLQGTKFTSLTTKSVEVALAPTEAPEVVEEAIITDKAA